MVKAYYNYENNATFGSVLPSVIPIPKIIVRNHKKCVVSASNESLLITCMKTHQTMHKIDLEPINALAHVSAFYVLPNSKKVFIGYSNGDITLFNINTNEHELKLLNNHKSITQLVRIENSLSEFLVATCQDNSVSIYDLQMRELIFNLKDHTSGIVKTLFFEKTSKLITVGKDGILRFYNFANCVLEHSMPTGKADLSDALILKIEETGNEVLLVSCSDDELLVIDLSVKHALKTIRTLKRNSFHKIVQLEILDQTILATTENQFMEIYSLLNQKEATKKFKRKLKRSVKDVSTIESYLSETEHYIYFEFEVKLPEHSKRFSLMSDLIVDNTFNIAFFTGKNGYRTSTLKLTEKTLEVTQLVNAFGHCHPILFSTISSDDFYLVSGSTDVVCLWELQNCSLVKKFAIEKATAALFLPKDRYLLIATSIGLIHLVDLNTRETVSTFNTSTHEENQSSKPTSVVDLRYNTSLTTGRLEIFSISSNSSVHVFSIQEKENSVTLKQVFHQRLGEEPTRIKFSNDGRFIFVAFLSNSVKMYHSDTFKEILAMYGHVLPVSDFDISTDDYVLASISLDKTIRIWDKDFGNCRRIINKVHENGGLRIQLVKDTHYAITTGKDGLVKLWDLDSFEMVALFETQLGSEIRAISLSREGNFFIVGGANKALRFFRQTKEQVFAIEVKDKLEEEHYVHEELKQGDKEMSKESVLKKYATVKSAEDIMDFVDEVERVQGEEQRGYELDSVALAKRDRPSFAEAKGLNPAEIVLLRLDKIPKSELSSILDFVHFRHLELLLSYANYAIENGLYQSLCFALVQFVVEKQQTNLLQNKSAMKVLRNLIAKMITSFNMGVKTANFNLAALCLNIQETRMINYK